jgi:pyridoxamine 5'-phosphate oxidase
MSSKLPDPTPADPMPLVEQWLNEAAAGDTKNPWAMALATTAGNQPSLRFVLLKSLSVTDGYCVFYSHYESRKAKELAGFPHAAACMYWPQRGRQLRFEGRVERSPQADSDLYFRSRTRGSQLNAWASEQSRPRPTVDTLAHRLVALEQRFPPDGPVPRPEHWGGYRFWLQRVEFWCEGGDRFHERLRYERPLSPAPPDGLGGALWRSEWLQP